MPTRVFQDLKFLLSPVNKASCALPRSLDELQWSWSARSESHNLKSGGFSLIELIMVLVLIGIIAAFAASRLPNITATNAGAFTDKLKADVRYAQNLAMTGNLRTRVVFTATSYEVQSSTTATCSSFPTATDPATGGPFLVTLDAGHYTGITLSGAACLEYDSLGTPYNCSAFPAACSTTAAGLTLNILPSGSVAITQQTGAVN